MTADPAAALDVDPLLPSKGQLVRVRARQYLVQEVKSSRVSGSAHLVRLACVEDYAQGERLEVLWEKELDAEVLSESWDTALGRPLDPPDVFGAYLSALRWSCVTATEPGLFQAPFRAGIEVLAYQLAPLEMALRLPRVNVFIADDVGLGKTIEAGLILRELLLRQRVTKVLVLAPAAVTEQWRVELSERFGLDFTVFDRDFVMRTRRIRGWRVNPFATGTSFILSHSLLHAEPYRTWLVDWLGTEGRGALLILDEAHHAAPASASAFGADSQFISALEQLVDRFEHRLFLSATPHNGHSESFSALLSLLDPIRFVRTTPVIPKLRDQIMVRRLKSDLRAVGTETFCERVLEEVRIDGLPESTPELELAAKLDSYNERRAIRFSGAAPGDRTAHDFVSRFLEKRLLSSIPAFRQTLAQVSQRLRKGGSLRRTSKSVSAVEEEAETVSSDEQREQQLSLALDSATSLSSAIAPPSKEELTLLDDMIGIADRTAHLMDARVKRFVEWLRQTLCPDLGGPGAQWLPRRVLVFTEWKTTLDYLEQQLRRAIAGSDRADDRIAVMHGGMSIGATGLPLGPDDDTPADPREAVKRAFNGDPAIHPVRILIATDSAREGINLHHHCSDLFHFDLPWNPTRLEQRNGRIDRKGQRAPFVTCRYFHYAQRPADAVSRALVKKTEVINKQLGSVNGVIAKKMLVTLERGATPGQRQQVVAELAALDTSNSEAVEVDLESVRRTRELGTELERLRSLLGRSRSRLRIDSERLRHTLDASLRHHGYPTFEQLDAAEPPRFRLPERDLAGRATPAYAALLDTLRLPREPGESPLDWRRRAPVRPVVFDPPLHPDDAVVQLHLEHRFVRRLLARFLSQGFPPAELSGITVATTPETQPYVMLIGRLSLFGRDATRLHDELVVVGARIDGDAVRLLPGHDDATTKLLDDALDTASVVPELAAKRLQLRAARDLAVLRVELDRRVESAKADAASRLTERGKQEAEDLRGIIASQIQHCRKRLRELENAPMLPFDGGDASKFAIANQQDLSDRIARLDTERTDIPTKVRNDYTVEVDRVLPVGLVYLWPRTG
ncbi:MAG: DEAD/DEAH box helicase [Myxococcales bacterium]|nr:DEAD/DEAH box helicase [Myxococcales bacterium]